MDNIFKKIRDSIDADGLSKEAKMELSSVLKDLLIGIQSVMLDQASSQLEAVLENGDDRKVREEAEKFLLMMKERRHHGKSA